MHKTAAPPTPTAVPFLDLITPHQELEEELVEVFRRALRQAAFVGGPEVEGFEREFAAFAGVPGSVAVNSGTDALRFAYIAMGIQPGDEVITVANTFIATTESITQAGGVVRFVDVDDDTLNMSPAAVEAAITPRTVGIVPVHLYGQPADLDPILEIAAHHRLWLIEDAAQAHGATYKGRPAGSIGDMGAFSFYPGKNLGSCGEGGAVTGRDPARLEVVRRLREHGQSRKYYYDTEGYNSRLHAIQAAFLRAKLKRLAEWNAARRHAALLYRGALSGIPDIRLPLETPFADHVYHLYVIHAERRDDLQRHLAGNQIGTGLHYPLPLHLQTAYAHLGLGKGSFPVSERAAEQILSLPMFPGITEEQVGLVARRIREFYGRD